MKRICAWCNTELKAKEEYASQGDISHGICSPCAIRITAIRPRSAKKLLNILHEPVFVIGSDAVVKAANKRGLEMLVTMLGKKTGDVENVLGGDAFECTYAAREGGCGQTIHCTTCALRNIIMDTLASGKGHKNVPAFQNINTAEGRRLVKFYISTERIGDSILLRIDEAIEIRPV